MFRHTVTICLWGLLTPFLAVGDVLCAAEPRESQSQQAEQTNGVTVDGLTRGVRSAAQNIEKEIPKIGAAVGRTIKSIGSNSSKKQPDRPQPTEKK